MNRRMTSMWAMSAAAGVLALGGPGVRAIGQPEAAPGAVAPSQAELLAQGKAEFVSAPNALEVKKAKTGHLLVRPRVNGKEAGWFIFDTGAGVCCVTKGKPEELGLRETGKIDALGVGGGKRQRMFRADEVRLGPLSLSGHPMMETDLGFLDQHMGESIAGVIGFGVFSKCVAEIDIEKPAISIFDPATYTLARGEWVEADFSDRVPVIGAKFEGREGRFRLDTGDHSTVVFHAPAVKKYNLLDGREVTDVKIGGVGGFVPAKRGTIKTLEIGGMKLEDLRADFATEGKGTLAEGVKDGNIGTGVLGRFVIVTDYSNERLALVAKE